MILGVCEWLGNRTNIDPKALRIGFLVGIVFFGAGLGLYLILWIVKMLSD